VCSSTINGALLKVEQAMNGLAGEVEKKKKQTVAFERCVF
jgi:hypothetical protein